MFDSTENPNPPPTAEESYASSTGASNLRVEADRRTPADMVIAAGMNPYRMGLALMRLRSEWDCSSKPTPLTAQQIEQLARKLDIEPPTRRVKVPMTREQIERVTADLAVDPAKLKGVDWSAGIVLPNPHAGLVRTEAEGKVAYRLPLAVAAEQAQDWYVHELGLLLQRMKTLPEVRLGLVHWVENVMGVRPGVHLVTAVLQWWLHPTCPACHGAKYKIVPGTGRTSSKACQSCRRSPGDREGTGERKVPHTWQGKKLLAHINASRGEAIKGKTGLNGKFRHHMKNEELFDHCMEQIYQPWMSDKEKAALRMDLKRRVGEQIDREVALAIHNERSAREQEELVLAILRAAAEPKL